MISNRQTTSIVNPEEFVSRNIERCGQAAIGVSMVPLTATTGCGYPILSPTDEELRRRKALIEKIEEVADFFPDYSKGACISAYIVNGAVYIGLSQVKEIIKLTNETRQEDRSAYIRIFETYFPRCDGRSYASKACHLVSFLDEEECNDFMTRAMKTSIMIPLFPNHEENETEDLLGYDENASFDRRALSMKGGTIRYVDHVGKVRSVTMRSGDGIASPEKYPVSPGVFANSAAGMFISDINKPCKFATKVCSGRLLPSRNIVIKNSVVNFNVNPDAPVYAITNPMYATPILYMGKYSVRVSVSNYISYCARYFGSAFVETTLSRSGVRLGSWAVGY